MSFALPAFSMAAEGLQALGLCFSGGEGQRIQVTFGEDQSSGMEGGGGPEERIGGGLKGG